MIPRKKLLKIGVTGLNVNMNSNMNTEKNNQIIAAIVLHAQDVLSESIDFMYGCSLIARAVKELNLKGDQAKFEPFIKLHEAIHHINIKPDWRTCVITESENELYEIEANYRQELRNACKTVLKAYHQ